MASITSWIRNFEGDYQITSHGEIFSWKSGEPKLLKPTFIKKTGHSIVCLKNEKNYLKTYLHRLVWSTFKAETIGPKDWIYHINGDRSDNRISNLSKKEVLSSEERAKVKRKTYKVIEDNGVEREMDNMEEIALYYGLTLSKVARALRKGKEIEVMQKKNLL